MEPARADASDSASTDSDRQVAKERISNASPDDDALAAATAARSAPTTAATTAF